jgi:hypothetical protein
LQYTIRDARLSENPLEAGIELGKIETALLDMRKHAWPLLTLLRQYPFKSTHRFDKVVDEVVASTVAIENLLKLITRELAFYGLEDSYGRKDSDGGDNSDRSQSDALTRKVALRRNLIIRSLWHALPQDGPRSFRDETIRICLASLGWKVENVNRAVTMALRGPG